MKIMSISVFCFDNINKTKTEYIKLVTEKFINECIINGKAYPISNLKMTKDDVLSQTIVTKNKKEFDIVRCTLFNGSLIDDNGNTIKYVIDKNLKRSNLLIEGFKLPCCLDNPMFLTVSLENDKRQIYFYMKRSTDDSYKRVGKIDIYNGSKTKYIQSVIETKNTRKTTYEMFNSHVCNATKSEEVLTQEATAYLVVCGISFFVTSVVPACDWAVKKIKNLRNSIKENLFSNNWFWKVEKDENIITIKNINYRALLYRIDELYGEDSKQGSNLKKLFFINYNDSDWKKYKKGKIKAKRDMRIKTVQFYEFFSMEMVNLFNSLADAFDLPVYNKIADKIIELSYLNNFVKIEKYTTPLNKEVEDELKDNPLLPHQKEFIELYPYLKKTLNLRGFILSFDQGLGKTLTSLSLSLQLKKKQVIVVCPNTLTPVWADEICERFQTYKNNPEKAKKDIFIPDDKTKRFSEAKDPKFIIVNNEAIFKIQNIVDPDKETIIIIDECQNFRYITGSRWADLYSTVQKCSKQGKLDVLCMSGTPIKAKPSEICPSLMCIDPLFTPECAELYVKAFDINSTSASQIINQRFALVIYRKTKEETSNLPEKHIIERRFSVKDESKFYIENVRKEISELFVNKYYPQAFEKVKPYAEEFEFLVNKFCKGAPSNLKEEYLKYLRNTIIKGKYMNIGEYKIEQFLNFSKKYIYPNIHDKRILKRFQFLESKYVYIRRSAMGLAIGEVLPKRRAEMFCSIIDENEEEIVSIIDEGIKKTALFSNSLTVVNKLCEMLTKNGISFVKITGSNAKDRKSLIDKFKNDDSCDCLVGTNSTMGVGVTITCANQELIFGAPWRKADFDQLSDRIHRIGQTTDCFIYNCLLRSKEKNLSDRMDEILNWSGDMVDSYIQSNNLKDE